MAGGPTGVTYGDHELPLYAGDSAVVIETGKGSLEIVRDLSREECRAPADSAGVDHLGAQPSYRFLIGLERSKDRASSAEFAWFPEPSLSTPDVYWPWFRAEAGPRLEAKAWQVEIDEGIGFQVHRC